ncbi:hypothetical protein CLV30_1047 [Haloactinopolyspora alba]|uniref:Uncharacterized protein n=1 Tax=Haloactinopolyspora alba TaxID=648780 RepID=A0A2P8E6Q2_9ACTN|nr:hypothetical protein [Haloactinopolyspora alba]PSL05145.1 hypothetical protein CLV30_1047 [Haloactinopolyspora alba]
MSADGDTTGGPPDLRALFSGTWHSLPAVLTGSVLVCAAAVPVVFASPGPNPVAAVLAAVLVTPAFAAVVALADRLWLGDDVTVRELAAAVPSCWRRGTGAGLVAAVPAALFLVAHEMWTQTAQPWLLVPMSVSGAATVVATLVLVVALPTSVREPATPHARVWISAAYAVARRPVPPIGAVALAGLGVWACVALSASVAVLVPGAVALTTAAAARTTLPCGTDTHLPDPRTRS